MHVDNDTFLRQLTALFETSNKKGSSIWLTHKRMTYDGADAASSTASDGQDSRQYPCLVRAVDNHKTKFSTLVQPGGLDKFNANYGVLLKNSMPKLRKRDKKREKERADRAAARKKRILAPVVIEGAKRGNGRRKRQRRAKAFLKQEESRKKFQEREKASVKSEKL